MGDARRVLDWDAQFACAIDPETAKAIRDARLPEDDHSDTCSMCGKFCAVRSMNKSTGRRVHRHPVSLPFQRAFFFLFPRPAFALPGGFYFLQKSTAKFAKSS